MFGGNVVIDETIVPDKRLLASEIYKGCLTLNKNMEQVIDSMVSPGLVLRLYSENEAGIYANAG